MNRDLRYWLIWGGIIAAILFFVSSSIAMYFYPGGTIHHRSGSDGYSFFLNYFSDLGRTRAWNGTSNWRSNLFFQSSLIVVGTFLLFYFLALPTIFREGFAKFMAALATVTGVIASLCYIGVALNPLDVDYWSHTYYVRIGFIAFLLMSFFYIMAILNEPAYPNRYARIFMLFSFVLGLQIVIMLFGPRSWHSKEALFLQATAQKIVVYAEMLCMLYQCTGALKVLKHRYFASQNIDA